MGMVLLGTWVAERPDGKRKLALALVSCALMPFSFSVVFIGGALLLDWKKALLYIVVPHQIGLFSVLVFNYLQHVHADELSDFSHSRNFTGVFLNAFLFNNGYHTVHHERPGLHWSETPAAHKKIEHLIHPSLNQRNTPWFLFRTFILSPFMPRYRSQSLRLERLAREQTRAPDAPATTSLAA